jgi:hypothetical protein
MADISSYWREQTRKRRERARAQGRCVICMSAQARPNLKTCKRCSDAATASTKARRARKRIPDAADAALDESHHPGGSVAA